MIQILEQKMLTLIIYWCVIYKLRYSIKARGWAFVTGYGFLSFAKSMAKNLSKSFSGKCFQKLLDHAKQSATDTLKTILKRAIQKAAETGDLISYKIASKITNT